MRYNKGAKIHHIDVFFVLVLFGIMAISLLTVITLGATVYSKTADLMQHNYETRTALGYVSGKVRQNDTRNGFEIADENGVSVLKLQQEVSGAFYSTYIYYYDGHLCEFFAADTLPFAPENGQRLLEIKSFEAELVDKGLVKLKVIDTSGMESEALVASRCT